ncbi:hypothetical protein TNCV_4951921 [Trichonephila clavipes]|nr:hypothetical protein TNCV_4951921 [Trichonephila clavipes]
MNKASRVLRENFRGVLKAGMQISPSTARGTEHKGVRWKGSFISIAHRLAVRWQSTRTQKSRYDSGVRGHRFAMFEPLCAEGIGLLLNHVCSPTPAIMCKTGSFRRQHVIEIGRRIR